MTRLTRRGLIAGGAGALIVVAMRPARATPETMRMAMAAFAGGAEIREGRVKIEIPPLVENGNSVPTTITVDSPMTEADHVAAIALFNERNPLPDIARFMLGPRCGQGWVSTRIRLGDTQQIAALAKMNDGSVWSATAELIVTLPACIEA